MFRRTLLAAAVAATLGITACASQDAFAPTDSSPSTSRAGGGARASSWNARSGELHVVKDCSAYTGHAGEICTITSSSLAAIPAGSTVTYASDAGANGFLDTDVVLRTPGRGNNTAFGHCALSLLTGAGRCTFSGGTGKFRHFSADVVVSYVGGTSYAWDGTYSFGAARD